MNVRIIRRSAPTQTELHDAVERIVSDGERLWFFRRTPFSGDWFEDFSLALEDVAELTLDGDGGTLL